MRRTRPLDRPLVTALHRLNKNARFGQGFPYAVEELTAELAAAYVCAELGVPQSEDMTNSVAYLAAWLRVLKAITTPCWGRVRWRRRQPTCFWPGGQVDDKAECVLAA